MAIKVLLGAASGKDFLHTIAHDIESVSYDLMVICVHQEGPCGKKRDFKEKPLPVFVYGG